MVPFGIAAFVGAAQSVGAAAYSVPMYEVRK
jgi:hypothetical protein